MPIPNNEYLSKYSCAILGSKNNLTTINAILDKVYADGFSDGHNFAEIDTNIK